MKRSGRGFGRGGHVIRSCYCVCYPLIGGAPLPTCPPSLVLTAFFTVYPLAAEQMGGAYTHSLHLAPPRLSTPARSQHKHHSLAT